MHSPVVPHEHSTRPPHRIRIPFLVFRLSGKEITTSLQSLKELAPFEPLNPHKFESKKTRWFSILANIENLKLGVGQRNIISRIH